MNRSCAFCGRSKDKVKELFKGPELYICNFCIETYNTKLHKQKLEESKRLKEEIDRAVSDSFRRIIANLDLGPLHEKYQLLMKVKFKEEPSGPSFEEVFEEFKRGVEQVIALDDYQTRYDLGIAYNEMGLREDGFRELVQSLRYALKHRDWEKAREILSVILYIGYDSKSTLEMISEIFQERG